MNWRLSQLDRYRLVSNSDAHSPIKLGRETTLFDGDLDYFAIRRALETGDGYVGTVEFFPEEGKYHLDGHRRCGVRLTPRETLEHNERCPACGEPVTVGVLHRVELLADRAEANTVPPATAGKASNLVPLAEILGELAGTGPSSKTVERSYDRLVATIGPELSILAEVPTEDLARADSPLFAEAITRLRAGQGIREAGYDGEYGVIHLFEPEELRQRTKGELLFDAPVSRRKQAERSDPAPASKPAREKQPATPSVAPAVPGLDAEQRRAVATVDGSLLIVAGVQSLPFADAVALATDADAWDPRADRVSLLTLHAAKGLEFPVVFIVGLEDGLLPLHWGGGADEAALAEERRLLYVGMTRAKDRLILSRALQRHWRGRRQTPDPSPFLSDIEKELQDQVQARGRGRSAREKQLTLL